MNSKSLTFDQAIEAYEEIQAMIDHYQQVGNIERANELEEALDYFAEIIDDIHNDRKADEARAQAWADAWDES